MGVGVEEKGFGTVLAERSLFEEKRERIQGYLRSKEGQDFLARTWDENKWELVGEPGSIKRVYRPKMGSLSGEKVVVRKSEWMNRPPSEGYWTASELRKESEFLDVAGGQHFVKVYAHAPRREGDQQGIGGYKPDRYWEVVDYVGGVTVDQTQLPDGRWGWGPRLTSGVKLAVLLAACECESAAMTTDPPRYLTDLKTDAFKVGKDGIVKMVDTQTHSDAVDYSQTAVAKGLGRLCLELFSPAGGGVHGAARIERAIQEYLDLQWNEADRRFRFSDQPPKLEEIVECFELPVGAKGALFSFLSEVRDRKPGFEEVPKLLWRRIHPIYAETRRKEAALEARRREQREGRAERLVGWLLTATEEERRIMAVQWYPDKKSGDISVAQMYADTMAMVVGFGKGWLKEEGNPLESRGESEFFGVLERLAEMDESERLGWAEAVYPEKGSPEIALSQFYADLMSGLVGRS